MNLARENSIGDVLLYIDQLALVRDSRPLSFNKSSVVSCVYLCHRDVGGGGGGSNGKIILNFGTRWR
jgi:hypothetical protein